MKRRKQDKGICAQVFVLVLLFCSSCIATLPVFCQQLKQEDTLIKWNELKKIVWSDFRAPANIASAYTAECVSFFSCSFFLRNDSVFCKIESFFNRSKSWKNKDSLDDYDLNHEQVHFDITELFARQLRKKIIESDFNELKIGELVKKTADDCEATQKLYDDETSHSGNAIEQSKWNEKINTAVSLLNNFKNCEIPVRSPVCKICWQ